MMSTSKTKAKAIRSKIENFWQNNETKIVLTVGMLLVAILTFQAGILQGQKWQQDPLIIEKPVSNGECARIPQDNTTETSKKTLTTEKANQTTTTPQGSSSVTSANCIFVGSKNSNKYHLPTCRWAKQIKPENIVCFQSDKDAEAKNYQPDKNCIK